MHPLADPLGRHPLGRHTPCPLGRHTRADTPPGQTHPLGRHTPSPWTDTPWADTPPAPQADTLWADTQPGQTPPAQCMLGYDQQVGGTHPTGMHSCYHPQQSWGKVIFSEVCVKNSVHMGESPGPPGGELGVWLGGSPGPHQGGKLGVWPGGLQTQARGVSMPTPREGVSRPRPGWCIPAFTEADTPPADGYCCGQYASYWNPFLFQNAWRSMSSLVP